MIGLNGICISKFCNKTLTPHVLVECSTLTPTFPKFISGKVYYVFEFTLVGRVIYLLFSILKQKKEVTVFKQSLPWMKSGDYLSSQRFSVSTFGVKELNFCVRNGNRWILFAIITAIVIYLASFSAYATYTNLIKPSSKEDLQLHSKFFVQNLNFSLIRSS